MIYCMISEYEYEKINDFYLIKYEEEDYSDYIKIPKDIEFSYPD